MKCSEIMECLEKLSPVNYAAGWDNVGLLVGRKDKEVDKVMVALDASAWTVKRAVEEKVDMLITHHPMIFSSFKKVNEDDPVSEKILTLAENRISYYAMHTNFDTIGGMGELAAGPEFLNLKDSKPLVFESDRDGIYGMGRGGFLPAPMTAEEVCEYVKDRFKLPFVMLYQNADMAGKQYDRIAVLPGSGKSELNEVKRLGYELYLTGDYSHHPGIDAMELGMTVIDATHYGLEKICVAFIADHLKNNYSELNIMEYDSGCPIRLL